MSRAYRISVSESASRVIHVEDGVQSQLELLPILPPTDMGEILAAELEKRGFKILREEGTAVRQVEGDNIIVEVELKTGKINVSIAEEVQIEETASLEGRGDEDHGVAGRKKLEEALQKQAKEAAERRLQNPKREEAERQRVTKRLEKHLEELQQELDGVVNRTTSEALKKRAAQIGEIEEISGDAESGDMTIKIKV